VATVDDVRESLLKDLRLELGPSDGLKAFTQHQLLAIRFHRGARLNRPTGVGEGEGWAIYFEEHFPRGSEHAHLLWTKWPVPLLKDETPGSGVAITHGQSQAHWVVTDLGLVVNLESMWDDYEASVESLAALLLEDAARRDATLDAWAKHQWFVQQVDYLMPNAGTTASIAASATSMSVAPRRE
jgi:hypothetical protein